MGKIYIGKESYFGIEAPKSRGKKAVVNAIAQLIDFLDGDTIVKKGGKFIKAKFTIGNAKGVKNVSFVQRMRVIKRYAPKSVEPILNQITKLAKLYAKGKITKKQLIQKAIALGKRAGFSAQYIKKIVNKVLRKD